MNCANNWYRTRAEGRRNGFGFLVRYEKLAVGDFALNEAYMVQVRALKQPDENAQPNSSF